MSMLRAWSAKRVPWSKPAEYMHSKPLSADNRPATPADEDEPEAKQHSEDRDEHREDVADDGDEFDARAREEAGNDWLAEQGFDRKDTR